MKFLNYDSNTELSVIKKIFADYRQYLLDNKTSFPPDAFDFAFSDWHYNFSDHRCPHDSWVNSLQVLEVVKNSSRKDRELGIRVNLLGAYHDGEIEITYQSIKGYSFNLIPDDTKWRRHGDWLIDEIYLSEKGWLVHEIKFWLFGEWRIECEDIKYEWLPFKK